MVNHVFVVDTCYLMNQRVPEYGLSLLDLVKISIYHSVQRRRSLLRADPTLRFKYALVSCNSDPYKCVLSGWEQPFEEFLKAVNQLTANDLPQIGVGIANAYRFLRSHRNHFTSHGRGWQTWNCENHVVIVFSHCMTSLQFDVNTNRYSCNSGGSLTDAIASFNNLTLSSNKSKPTLQPPPQSSNGSGKNSKSALPTDRELSDRRVKRAKLRNEILAMPQRNMEGESLDMDWIQWNTRMFVAHLQMDGTTQCYNHSFQINEMMANFNPFQKRQPPTADNGIMTIFNDFCASTNPTGMESRVINNVISSLHQLERWTSGVLRDTSRESFLIELQHINHSQSSSSAAASSSSNSNGNANGNGNSTTDSEFFGDGQIVKEILIPVKTCGRWPIPEDYVPDQVMKEYQMLPNKVIKLPARPPYPRIRIAKVKNSQDWSLPKPEWNVQFETYELYHTPLCKGVAHYILSQPPDAHFWCYLCNSLKPGYLGKPFADIQADHRRGKVFMHVFCYDFPFVWSLLNDYFIGTREGWNKCSHYNNVQVWTKVMREYITHMPQYYHGSLRQLFENVGIDPTMIHGLSQFVLEPSVAASLLSNDNYWKRTAQYRVSQITMGDTTVGLASSGTANNNNRFNNDNTAKSNIDHNSNNSSSATERRVYSYEKIDKPTPMQVDDKKTAAASSVTTTTIAKEKSPSREPTIEEMALRYPPSNTRDLSIFTQFDSGKMTSMIGTLQKALLSQVRTDAISTQSDPVSSEKLHALSTMPSSSSGRLVDENTEENRKLKAVCREAENELFTKDALHLPRENNRLEKLIISQSDIDRQHTKPIATMGNYAAYLDRQRNRNGKTDEFRDPFDFETDENEGYSLSLSFAVLHHKDNQFQSSLRRKKSSALERHRAFRERLDSLMSKSMNPSSFGHNDTTNAVNSAMLPPILSSDIRFEHRKTPQYLAQHFDGKLRPTNLGGNPWKSKRKRSPFPSVKQPRNVITGEQMANAAAESIRQMNARSGGSFRDNAPISIGGSGRNLVRQASTGGVVNKTNASLQPPPPPDMKSDSSKDESEKKSVNELADNELLQTVVDFDDEFDNVTLSQLVDTNISPSVGNTTPIIIAPDTSATIDNPTLSTIPTPTLTTTPIQSQPKRASKRTFSDATDTDTDTDADSDIEMNKSKASVVNTVASPPPPKRARLKVDSPKNNRRPNSVANKPKKAPSDVITPSSPKSGGRQPRKAKNSVGNSLNNHSVKSVANNNKRSNKDSIRMNGVTVKKESAPTIAIDSISASLQFFDSFRILMQSQNIVDCNQLESQLRSLSVPVHFRSMFAAMLKNEATQYSQFQVRNCVDKCFNHM